MLKYWDIGLGTFAIIFNRLSKEDVAVMVGIITIFILIPRAIMAWIGAYQKWRDRKQPWKGEDDE